MRLFKRLFGGLGAGLPEIITDATAIAQFHQCDGCGSESGCLRCPTCGFWGCGRCVRTMQRELAHAFEPPQCPKCYTFLTSESFIVVKCPHCGHIGTIHRGKGGTCFRCALELRV